MKGKSRKKNTKDVVDAKKEVKKGFFSQFLKASIIFAILIAILISVFAAIKLFNFNISEMVWNMSLTKGTDAIGTKSVSYSSFANGLMRFSGDGITYIDGNKNLKYTIAYNIKDPLFVKNDKYFVVANKNGNDFMIFDTNGLVSKGTTINTIEKIALSDDGTVYTLLSDGISSYIYAYNNLAQLKNLNIRSKFTDNGMPIDFAVSRDGRMVLTADVRLDGNDIYSNAIYYDGDNLKKKFEDEFSGKYLARVNYFENGNSSLIYDGGIYFVESKFDSDINVIKKVEFQDKMRSIAYNDKFTAIVFIGNKLLSFDSTGQTIADFSIDFSYDNFYIDDDYIIFISDRRVIIYDIYGSKIFDKEMEKDVHYVGKKKSLLFTELLVGLTDSVECIRFY